MHCIRVSWAEMCCYTIVNSIQTSARHCLNGSWSYDSIHRPPLSVTVKSYSRWITPGCNQTNRNLYIWFRQNNKSPALVRRTVPVEQRAWVLQSVCEHLLSTCVWLIRGLDLWGDAAYIQLPVDPLKLLKLGHGAVFPPLFFRTWYQIPRPWPLLSHLRGRAIVSAGTFV